MCNGKCQERAGQTRSTIIKLGVAARELAKLVDFPQMVVKTPLYIAIVPADPELSMTPGLLVIMEVYPTTTDDEVARKADLAVEPSVRPVPKMVQTLEAFLGLPPTPNGVDTQTA